MQNNGVFQNASSVLFAIKHLFYSNFRCYFNISICDHNLTRSIRKVQDHQYSSEAETWQAHTSTMRSINQAVDIRSFLILLLVVASQLRNGFGTTCMVTSAALRFCRRTKNVYHCQFKRRALIITILTDITYRAIISTISIRPRV